MKLRNLKNQYKINILITTKIGKVDEMSRVPGDFLIFRIKNKYGWSSPDLKKTFFNNYDYCYPFENGFGVFKRDGLYGWVNSNGVEINYGFKECYHFKKVGIFKDNCGFFGFVNADGEIIRSGLSDCEYMDYNFLIIEKFLELDYEVIYCNGKCYPFMKNKQFRKYFDKLFVFLKSLKKNQ